MIVASSFIAIALSYNAASAQPELPAPIRPGQFPIAANDEAWAKLPLEVQVLPRWSRMLVGAMPKATARMLELDYLHRAKNPLGPVLSGKIRRVVAETLASKSGVSSAETDLRAAGLTAADLADLVAMKVTPAERVALTFSKTLTLAGSTITDAEFAELLKLYGPEKVTAIVHTVAYANFHNRILLGIGATGAPVPPLDVRFDTAKLTKISSPVRPPWDDLKSVKADGLSVRVDWTKDDIETVHATLEKQKERKLRIPLPDKKLFEKLPPRDKYQSENIAWMTVSNGYQLEMTQAWFACLSAYYEDAKVDRVFVNSVFWVVTRTNDCFY